MPRLEQLNTRLQAHLAGEAYTPPSDPINEVVEAINGIHLKVEQGASHEFSADFEKLGKAMKSALESHGKGLVKALSGLSVSVEAPVVTVGAPEVEAVIQLPEAVYPSTRVRVTERDGNGDILELEMHPVAANESNVKPTATYDME